MTLLIIIQIISAVLLIVFILLQHSDNEGLGFGGGGNLGGLMSARGSANFLSRATAITATVFMIMSVVMTIVASSSNEKKILESLPNLETNSDNTTNISEEEPSIPDSN
tara:strand:+ start:413 stop:739 length:327 start_codon:yes stop_codon:yes gene_type:complete